MAGEAGSKLVHKALEPLTSKERLADFDDAEAAVLARVLVDDPTFQRKAACVADAAEDDRRAVAQREAGDYCRYRSPGRDLIASYLLLAAEAPWRRFTDGCCETSEAAARRDCFANLSRRAVWAEAPLEETDPMRARRRETTLEEGAKRIARLGAGQCVSCGTTLSEQYVRIGVSRRRTRRERCDLCEGTRDLYREAIREAFEAATRQRQGRRAGRRP